MKDDLPQKLDDKEIVKRYIKSIGKGILKVMSKMGISTYQSYCGAQIFDAVGLQTDFVEQLLHRHRDHASKASASTEIAEETVRRHRDAFGDSPVYRDALDVGGDYAVPPARRGACLDAGDGRDAAACRARQLPATSTASSRKLVNEQAETAAHHPRPVPHQERGGRRPHAGAARGGRAGARTSSSASRPARCPTARSRARRTPRSPSP